MNTTTCFQFDTTTQFTWEEDKISLCQGSSYIAKGYLADWLMLFQNGDKLEGNDNCITISDTLAVQWDKSQQAIAIQDSCTAQKALVVTSKELQQLEDSLLELHQGCCGPVSFNFVADIIQEPDEILQLLQDITSFKLSDEQLKVAKDSISLLPTEYEIDVLDLYNLWEYTPELAYFAKALKFYFLSS